MKTQPVLYSSRAGVFVLQVEGETYVCSSFQLRMELNHIQTAAVVVGCGRSLLGDTKFDNNAEGLYQQIQQQALTGENTLIPCSVSEVLQGHAFQAFNGYIVAASLVYKTGSATIRAVRFELMGLSCTLQAQPLSAYTNVCGAYIVESLLSRNAKQLTQIEALTRQGMQINGSLVERAVIDKIRPKVTEKDMATRVACIADAFVIMSSHTFNKLNPTDLDTLGSFLGIDKCLYSSCMLNKAVLDKANTLTDSYFNEALCAGLMSGISGGTVFDSIVRVLTSTDFMLTLVPRLDGRMEIKPTNAWGAYNNIPKLPLAAVSSMNSAWHPLDHLNDPEVFAVNFTDALNMSGSQGLDGAPSTMIGAYSKDPEMAKWLKARLTQSPEAAELEAAVRDMANFKWLLTRSPRWLHNVMVRSQKKPDDAAAQAAAIESQKSRDTVNDSDQDKAVQYDFNIGEDMADAVAQALYTVFYKQSDTATLELLPDVRFGLYRNKYGGLVLENMIGELIDIEPAMTTDPDRLNNQPLAVRGMVSAISFSYNAGQSASCQYSITLSRVRAISEDEPKIDCPLYTATGTGTSNASAAPDLLRVVADAKPTADREEVVLVEHAVESESIDSDGNYESTLHVYRQECD